MKAQRRKQLEELAARLMKALDGSQARAIPLRGNDPRLAALSELDRYEGTREPNEPSFSEVLDKVPPAMWRALDIYRGTRQAGWIDIRPPERQLSSHPALAPLRRRHGGVASSTP